MNKERIAELRIEALNAKYAGKEFTIPASETMEILNLAMNQLDPRVTPEMWKELGRAEHSLSAQDGVLTKDRIREIFLANGFTIKDGCDDLKPYVYAAADALLAAAAPSPAVAVEPKTWQPSEEQFESWRARHGLHHSHNEAFYDAASLYLDATPSPSLAVRDVVGERQRQISAEGWTPEHDDQYEDAELCSAAACYTMANDTAQYEESPNLWPWSEDWWKPTTERRNLVKAGALILAEIERLDRAAKKGGAA